MLGKIQNSKSNEINDPEGPEFLKQKAKASVTSE